MKPKKKTEVAGYISASIKKRNWSQRDLARESDLTDAEISLILSGRRGLGGARVIASLAHALAKKKNRTTVAIEAWTLIELAIKDLAKGVGRRAA